MERFFDIAFTPAVAALQERRGSREHYARATEEWPAPRELGAAEREHIAARDSFYLASVGESGWPYVQHRGGEAGFVAVLGPTTIGWVERNGNRQYVNAGNISADGRVAMIMVDYPNRTRLKLYGTATHHADPDPELLERLGGSGVRHDGAITVDVVAVDWNCPKYITPRYTAEQIEALTAPLRRRIADLESQVAGARPAPSG